MIEDIPPVSEWNKIKIKKRRTLSSSHALPLPAIEDGDVDDSGDDGEIQDVEPDDPPDEPEIAPEPVDDPDAPIIGPILPPTSCFSHGSGIAPR